VACAACRPLTLTQAAEASSPEASSRGKQQGQAVEASSGETHREKSASPRRLPSWAFSSTVSLHGHQVLYGHHLARVPARQSARAPTCGAAWHVWQFGATTAYFVATVHERRRFHRAVAAMPQLMPPAD